MSAKKSKLIKILTDAGVTKTKAEGIADAIVEANKDADDNSGRSRFTGANATQKLVKELQKQELGLDRILNKYERILKSSSLYREELERFSMAGYNRSFTDFADSIDFSTKVSLKLTGNLKAAEEALSGLRTGFKGFGLISKDLRKEFTEFSTTLAAAGYDVGSFGKILDSSAFAFGSSAQEIKSMSAQLVNLQRNLAIAPKELTENFQYAQKNFAYTSGKIMENFAKLSKMSRETGVDFSKLAGSFGESMDTFEGAAQMAGGLNQILGGSVFNSIELLSMDEATRAQKIRQEIQGRLGARGLGVNQLGKFELKAIGSRLNLSVEETRRFLRTGELGKGVEGEGMGKVRSMEMAGFDEANAKAADFSTALGEVEHDLRRFRKPLEMAFMAMEATLSDTLKKAIPAEFQGGMAGEVAQRARVGLSTVNLSEMPAKDFTLGEAIEMQIGVMALDLVDAADRALQDAINTIKKDGLKGAALKGAYDKASNLIKKTIGVGVQVASGEILLKAAADRTVGPTAPGTKPARNKVQPINTSQSPSKTGAGASVTSMNKFSGYASVTPTELFREMRESNRATRELIQEIRMRKAGVGLGVGELVLI